MRKPNPPNVLSLLSLARPAAVCAVAALLVFSCVLDTPKTDPIQEDETPKPLSELLSIEDARALFGERAGRVDIFGSGTRSDDLPEPDILWEDAIYSAFFGYEVIESQIGNIIAATHNNDDPDIWGVTVGDLIPANTVIHLISGIDSSDSVRFRIVHLIPAPSFLKSKRINLRNFRLWDTAEGYTGAIHLFEITGEFVRGFEVVEGVLDGIILPADCGYEGGEEGSVVMYAGMGGNITETGEEDDTKIVQVESVTISATRKWKYDWSQWDWPVINPWDGSEDTGGGGGNGGNNTNPQTCQTCKKSPCECCTECGKHPCECKEPEDPCENLMNKLNDPAYKDLLDWMKREGVTLTYESGRFNTYSGASFQITSLDGQPGEPGIYFNRDDIPLHATGFTHCHYIGLLKTFSPDDLFVPYQIYMAARGVHLPSFSFGLVTSEGVYFLFVHDINKYVTFWNLWGESGINKIDYEYEQLKISTNTSDSKSAEGLLKVLKKLDLGMTLMKMKPNGTGFVEMNLKTFGGVKEVECRTL